MKYATANAFVAHGDCLDLLAQLEANTVDAVVTDPPYGLSSEPDIAEVLTHWLAGDRYEHGSAGFMGKTWDSFVPGPEYWREVFRVMKPGAHALVFAGTRTQDLMTIALRLAGFEIRDVADWLYGSGFPKSLDVSKAIDKAAGAEREIVGPNPHARPSDGQTFVNMGAKGHDPNITAPATDDARRWSGWGTALKPAREPIIIARKPLEGTVAQNVLRWGTGALNIDGCRIRRAEGDRTDYGRDAVLAHNGSVAMGAFAAVTPYAPNDAGRWPANVLLDEEAAAALDAQSGDRSSTRANGNPNEGRRDRPSTSVARGAFAGTVPGHDYRDTGGASRFFYVAKTSRKERDLGCESLPAKSGGEATDRDDDTDGLKSPRAGAGRGGGVRNHHPTVKPIALMRYLVRLVTPPGGVVLDPFTGSGSTGAAAVLEGFEFLGMEREPDYTEIAALRIAASGEGDPIE